VAVYCLVGEVAFIVGSAKGWLLVSGILQEPALPSAVLLAGSR
jgi:hypothetical protein